MSNVKSNATTPSMLLWNVSFRRKPNSSEDGSQVAPIIGINLKKTVFVTFLRIWLGNSEFVFGDSASKLAGELLQLNPGAGWMNPRSTPAVAAHPQPRHHGLLPAETTFPRVPRGPGRRVELCRLEPGLRQDGGFAVSSSSAAWSCFPAFYRGRDREDCLMTRPNFPGVKIVISRSRF